MVQPMSFKWEIKIVVGVYSLVWVHGTAVYWSTTIATVGCLGVACFG